ncbi:MAG: EamA family transporter [Holosporaceae bacterium]|nr:MAG: EamA family transporter [Holosporaceae bacterium]
MHIKHIALALTVALLWGANFTVMKVGMGTISPLIFSALRSLIILPLLFFIPRPKISWRTLLLIGLLIGTFKLPLMLLAISLGVATGLTSLIVQVQAFFTVVFAWAVFNQQPSLTNWVGMAVSMLGIGLISIQIDGSASMSGLIVIIISAIFWAISNIVIQKKCLHVDMLSLTIWINIVPPIPLLFLSYYIYGHEEFAQSFSTFTLTSFWALLYAGFCAGLLGYTIWGHLLKKYPAAIVAPFSLLVPVFGISFAYYAINEMLTPTSILGSLLVIFGLIVNQIKLKKIL